jgi:hypothetical protein
MSWDRKMSMNTEMATQIHRKNPVKIRMVQNASKSG